MVDLLLDQRKERRTQCTFTLTICEHLWQIRSRVCDHSLQKDGLLWARGVRSAVLGRRNIHEIEL